MKKIMAPLRGEFHRNKLPNLSLRAKKREKFSGLVVRETSGVGVEEDYKSP